jgi:hypothetical protein
MIIIVRTRDHTIIIIVKEAVEMIIIVRTRDHTIIIIVKEAVEMIIITKVLRITLATRQMLRL